MITITHKDNTACIELYAPPINALGLEMRQRLPRIAGLEAATQMILSGDSVKGDFALSCGLVDQLFERGEAFLDQVLRSAVRRRMPTPPVLRHERHKRRRPGDSMLKLFRSLPSNGLKTVRLAR